MGPQPPSEQAVRYRYAPLYRPPGFATVPGGWSLVERGPLHPVPLRPDLPMGKRSFGVIDYVRKLTDEEVADYQLDPLGGVD